MRFLADENISNLVISVLGADGHDVLSIRSGHAGSDDTNVLAIAEADGRILITEDHDFGQLVVRQKLPVVGVMLLELDRLSNAAEAARVRSVVASESCGLIGHFVVVEVGRIRRRPIG
jgi:predicted nuclease of predicted toxin-antitoxin system